ncbi:MAG: SufD family Fe-S cluster assembly protein [Solobacterium sp.]|nr:SufD family Fe-S cluster assembly protein [Solobacterium sp.]
METIRASQEILLQEGYNAFEIDTEEAAELKFVISRPCDVFVRIRKASELKLETKVEDGIKAAILFYNSCDETIHAQETYSVGRDADLTIAYGECSHGDVYRDSRVALKESGAKALLSSASLVNERKEYNIEVANLAPHTFGEIRNYAVVLADGRLMIDAIGRIVKGAYRSESHQTSRALSFADGQRSEILPELLIDENDVQASHAMSIGRVDEDQLYYMMSRGLSIEQCTSLISTGYLMPITEILSNEELRGSLAQEMERKISELCSM